MVIFHNIAVLLVYAVSVALLLHPAGIRLADSFLFASIGFAAHMFEDALIANPAYPFLLAHIHVEILLESSITAAIGMALRIRRCLLWV